MTQQARLSPSTTYAEFTAAEFLRVVDSGALADVRVELVRGEIVKMMPFYLAHGEANVQVAARMLPLFAGRARIATDLMLAIGPATIRAADLAVVRTDAPRDRPVDAPDVLLVVEIAASTLSEDLGAKLADYAAAAIRHYWIVDLDGCSVHVMSEPEQDRYASRTLFRFGEPIPVPGTDATIVID